MNSKEGEENLNEENTDQHISSAIKQHADQIHSFKIQNNEELFKGSPLLISNEKSGIPINHQSLNLGPSEQEKKQVSCPLSPEKKANFNPFLPPSLVVSQNNPIPHNNTTTKDNQLLSESILNQPHALENSHLLGTQSNTGETNHCLPQSNGGEIDKKKHVHEEEHKTPIFQLPNNNVQQLMPTMFNDESHLNVEQSHSENTLLNQINPTDQTSKAKKDFSQIKHSEETKSVSDLSLESIEQELEKAGLLENLKDVLKKLWNEPLRERALGCIAGAFIGDSIGSYLEFNRNPLPNIIDEAMTMPGRGTFNLVPGQVTDDSELALCLAQGLISGNGDLHLDHIAAKYRDWIQSCPFDVGNTIGTALYSVYEITRKVGDFRFYKKILKRASTNNMNSESNGCLMRITPLAVWCRNLSKEDIKKAVEVDVKLTHPNETVVEACYYWVLALVKLINFPDNPSFTKNENIKIRMKTVYDEMENLIKQTQNKDILEWWQTVQNEEIMDANVKMGWAKIAWTYGFIFIKRGVADYKDIIRKIISKGGDTDTNACIVGGMIGAAIGLKSIPFEYLKIMIGCDSTKGHRPRSDFFNPRNGLLFGDKIFDIAPNILIKK